MWVCVCVCVCVWLARSNQERDSYDKARRVPARISLIVTGCRVSWHGSDRQRARDHWRMPSVSGSASSGLPTGIMFTPQAKVHDKLKRRVGDRLVCVVTVRVGGWAQPACLRFECGRDTLPCVALPYLASRCLYLASVPPRGNGAAVS
ncbi:hypothetical protein LZ30DRAFT_239205 [Colletotrichum cereale]|nr:hypothetical protein LZ30DRAFT_239205 [Colletotrichum cereale]